MRVINDGNFTYLSIKDEFGRVNNQQTFIIAKSSWGKGLASAGMAQTYYDEGYQVIVLADPKDEAEYGFCVAEPEEEYHKKELRRTGIQPKAMPCKIYHPFSFRLPKTLLPEMNIFTLPIKDLTTDEFAFLAETDYQTEAVRLFLNAAENMPDSGGIYTFLHKIQDLVKGRRSGRVIKASASNFYLEASAGTLKSVVETSAIMRPFKTDYFLSSKTCPLNIDWKKLLADQFHYHVFIANQMPYKKNKKVRDFLVLSLVSQIISNIKYAKSPLLLIFPEISNQIPARPEGHEKFLAKSLRRLITTCRSQGRGISTISDNQTLVDIDEGFSNSCTVTLLGQLVGARDIDRIYKSYGYKQELRKRLLDPTYKNSFTLVGKEDEEFYIRFPSHRWAESEQNFEKTYAKYFKDKMRSYGDIIDKMSAELKAEEEKFREKAKRKEQTLKRLEEERKRGREESSAVKKADEKMEKAKQKEGKAKEELMRLVYEAKEEDPKISYRKLGKKFGISNHTVKKYLEGYEKIAQEKEGEDFEEEVLEDLEGNEEENDAPREDSSG